MSIDYISIFELSFPIKLIFKQFISIKNELRDCRAQLFN